MCGVIKCVLILIQGLVKKLGIGDRAILLVNKPEYNKEWFYKGHMFNVESIDNLVNRIFKVCDVDLNYGTTCHKYQGQTSREPFNIYEVEKISLEILFTALRRVTCLDNIHIDNTKLRKFYKSEFGGQVFREITGKVESGSIYEVRIGDARYIGMAMGTIEKRFAEHTNDPESAVRKFMKNPVISLIGVINGNEK